MKTSRYEYINDEQMNLIKIEHDKCTGCGACMKECPMLKAYCSSPKNLLYALASGKYFSDHDQDSDYIQNLRMPFTCTLCGYCDHVCPENVSLKNIFYALKKDIIHHMGYPKAFGKLPLSFHQNLSFSRAFSSRPVKSKKNDTAHSKNRLFIPGCSPSAYSPNIVTSVYKALNDQSPTIFLKKCCGNPTLSVGNIKEFKRFTQPLVQEVNALAPSEIIVLCMNCYNTFRKLFPTIPVLTIWEVYLRDGLPSHRRGLDKGSSKFPPFTLHDPCPTRHHGHIHEAVRQVLNLMQVEFFEYKANKHLTVCCGSGAMLSLIHTDLSEAHKSKRAKEAQTEHILTYCQECAESLNRSDKKAVHILDLLFGEMSSPNYEGGFEQEQHTTLKKWMHRRIVKSRSDSTKNGNIE
ncbi:(Fe-S)-binding protein [Fusibacter sp. JL216-2]|uniref:(Fe-S)-binding protein n=1 Tax=Fusibacter sp. JL216-2 TaxID=3071453 RepID=UPI003D339EE0